MSLRCPSDWRGGDEEDPTRTGVLLPAAKPERIAPKVAATTSIQADKGSAARSVTAASGFDEKSVRI